MDVYQFIKSPDVIKHCKKIEKNFNSLEKAVLISRSIKPIALKHQAYMNIIEHDEDMAIPNTAYIVQTNLKELLRDILNYEQELLANFLLEDNKSYYRYEITYDARAFHFWEDYDFSSHCLQDVFSAIKNMFLDYDDISYYRITKYTLNSYKHISVIYSPSSDIIDITENRFSAKDVCKRLASLKDCYIDIPTPFEKGDILISQNHTIFVLEHFLEKYTLYEYSMCGHRVVRSYASCPPFELCYYTKKLTEYERFLEIISTTLKHNMDIADIISAYCHICGLQNIKSGPPPFPLETFTKIL